MYSSSTSIDDAKATQAVARVPMHGALEAKRRRWVRRCIDRLLSDQSTYVGVGELPRRGIHRILVCRPNHRLGNSLMIGPLLEELEQQYPGAEIDILGAGPAVAQLFGHYHTVRDVHTLDARIVRHLPTTMALLGKVRATRYDLAIDAGTGSQTGRLLVAMTKARYKLAMPLQGASGEPARPPEHMALRIVHGLRQALDDATARPWPRLDLRLHAAELARGQETLEGLLRITMPSTSGPVVALFANATGGKRYDARWWSEFVETLTRLRPELRFIEIVAAHGVSQLDSRYPAFYSTDLRRMAALIAATNAFISADCGVMHLAVASQVRTLGLFSITDPAKYAPYGGDNAGFVDRGETPAQMAARIAEHLPGVALA